VEAGLKGLGSCGGADDYAMARMGLAVSGPVGRRGPSVHHRELELIPSLQVGVLL